MSDRTDQAAASAARIVQVRIDSVTRRFFDKAEEPVGRWMSQLRRTGFGGRTWTHRAAGNPCDEIPLEPYSRTDLLSCRCVRPEAGPSRIMGGRLHLAAGATFIAPGDAPSEERETGRLIVPHAFPDTILLALVGVPATHVVDEPVLEGCIVLDSTSSDEGTTFTISVEWEIVTVEQEQP